MKSVAIIGAGPGGLMAAEVLARRGFQVTIHDHRPTAARKFLMAGRGGLNITHSEPIDDFMKRYGESADFLRPAIQHFTPQNLRDWCHDLGEDTFVGTSGRVFPKSFKASPLLRAWLKRLESLGVTIHYNSQWSGQDMNADITILAMGGASWPRLGSDAAWVDILRKHNIVVHPFRPANSGFTVQWSDVFKNKYAGQPLKPVLLKHNDIALQGEIMITQNGVEGGGIYAMSKSLRNAIEQNGETILSLDLKPNVPLSKIEQLLSAPRGRDSFSNYLRKTLSLSPVAIGLLQEDRNASALSATDIAARIKSLPLTLPSVADIDRAISSAGGIARDEVDANFQLKKMSNIYAIGEMLDWEAPTGGYLLQATFSMAVWCANHID